MMGEKPVRRLPRRDARARTSWASGGREVVSCLRKRRREGKGKSQRGAVHRPSLHKSAPCIDYARKRRRGRGEAVPQCSWAGNEKSLHSSFYKVQSDSGGGGAAAAALSGSSQQPAGAMAHGFGIQLPADDASS